MSWLGGGLFKLKWNADVRDPSVLYFICEEIAQPTPAFPKRTDVMVVGWHTPGHLAVKEMVRISSQMSSFCDVSIGIDQSFPTTWAGTDVEMFTAIRLLPVSPPAL